MEDDDVYGLLRGILIGGVGVTLRVSDAMGGRPRLRFQTEALTVDPYDGVAATANEKWNLQGAELLEQGGAGIAARSITKMGLQPGGRQAAINNSSEFSMMF